MNKLIVVFFLSPLICLSQDIESFSIYFSIGQTKSSLFNKSEILKSNQINSEFTTLVPPSSIQELEKICYAITFQYHLNNNNFLLLRPSYLMKGQKRIYGNNITITDSLEYFTLPILYQRSWRVDKKKRLEIFVNSGCYLSYLTSFGSTNPWEDLTFGEMIHSQYGFIFSSEIETELSNNINKIDYGLVFGYGLYYKINKKIDLDIGFDASANFGLKNTNLYQDISTKNLSVIGLFGIKTSLNKKND